MIRKADVGTNQFILEMPAHSIYKRKHGSICVCFVDSVTFNTIRWTRQNISFPKRIQYQLNGSGNVQNQCNPRWGWGVEPLTMGAISSPLVLADASPAGTVSKPSLTLIREQARSSIPLTLLYLRTYVMICSQDFFSVRVKSRNPIWVLLRSLSANQSLHHIWCGELASYFSGKDETLTFSSATWRIPGRIN